MGRIGGELSYCVVEVAVDVVVALAAPSHRCHSCHRNHRIGGEADAGVQVLDVEVELRHPKHLGTAERVRRSRIGDGDRTSHTARVSRVRAWEQECHGEWGAGGGYHGEVV